MKSTSKILVIDDNPDLRQALARMLAQAGHEVAVAGSGNEGLAVAHQFLPDLVLLDVVLPDSSGVDICRDLKRNPPRSRPLVILMSGLVTDPDEQADEYISHPVAGREMHARVAAMLRLKSAEESLTQINVELEKRVQERTAQLELSNCVLMQEIAERKRAEEERSKWETQAQRMQKLESMGVLARGVAHDFNNLLTAILGEAGLARLEAAPGSPVHAGLQNIEKISLRAAELCRQMLVYAGQGRFMVEPCNLSAVVQEFLPLLSVSVSKQASLQCQFAENLPVIDADPAQVRQAVMNLVTNASEAFEGRQGVISIRTGAIGCDEDYLRQCHIFEPQAIGTNVFLEVADTGCGIDAETCSKIFDPFFSTKFAGRGLGLAAVLGIVRWHRGTIRVDTQQGRGSSFRMLFPTTRKRVIAHAI